MGRSEVFISGRAIDVTELIEKRLHPGGNVIKYYVGKDATEAFAEFHARSPRAEKWQKSLPSRPLSDDRDPLLEDFAILRRELERDGFFDVSYSHIAYRFCEILVLNVLAFVLLFRGHTTVASILLGVGAGRAGWLMHEAGHYSLTGRPSVDRQLQMILFGLFDGMSASFWRNQHNKHHATPQKLKHDVDLNTMPLVAFDRETRRHSSGMTSWWLTAQSVLFFPLTTALVSLGWMAFLHPRHALRSGNYLELVYMGARYTLIYAFVVPRIGLNSTLYTFALSAWCGGIYIFGNFALSHTHKPTLQATEHTDWVRFAANHTTNITPSWWCDWWMGFLNYQIEHHLFPAMPQFRFRAVAPRVKKLLAKHGIDYDVRSYGAAVVATITNLHTVGMGDKEKSP